MRQSQAWFAAEAQTSQLRRSIMHLSRFSASCLPPPHHTNASQPAHHGRDTYLTLPLGRSCCHRRQRGAELPLRRQRRNPRRHLRPSVRSQGKRRQRGHTFLGPMAATGNCLRCQDEAEEYQHNDGIQRFADGHTYAEGVASPGGQAAAQDLPSASISSSTRARQKLQGPQLTCL